MMKKTTNLMTGINGQSTLVLNGTSKIISNADDYQVQKAVLELKSNPYYLTGFTDGEGCFSVTASSNSTTGLKFSVEFKISQSCKSTDLLYAIQHYLGCGSVNWENIKLGILRFHVTNLTDLNQIIIPFFDNYPLFI